MKKIIVIALILITGSLKMMAGVTVGLTVEFGHRDPQNNCIERGLCKVGITVGRAITVNMNDTDGSLVFKFQKTSNMSSVYEYQFANGVFELPNDYNLPVEVCDKLGIDKFVLKRGKYKVVFNNGYYSIVFPKG